MRIPVVAENKGLLLLITNCIIPGTRSWECVM